MSSLSPNVKSTPPLRPDFNTNNSERLKAECTDMLHKIAPEQSSNPFVFCELKTGVVYGSYTPVTDKMGLVCYGHDASNAQHPDLSLSSTLKMAVVLNEKLSAYLHPFTERFPECSTLFNQWFEPNALTHDDL